MVGSYPSSPSSSPTSVTATHLSLPEHDPSLIGLFSVTGVLNLRPVDKPTKYRPTNVSATGFLDLEHIKHKGTSRHVDVDGTLGFKADPTPEPKIGVFGQKIAPPQPLGLFSVTGEVSLKPDQPVDFTNALSPKYTIIGSLNLKPLGTAFESDPRKTKGLFGSALSETDNPFRSTPGETKPSFSAFGSAKNTGLFGSARLGPDNPFGSPAETKLLYGSGAPKTKGSAPSETIPSFGPFGFGPPKTKGPFGSAP